ncbi:MAG TPA: NADH-quinone oxidoreductase subunit NuoN [Burkholderiaceae bacterium]|nr:NADH-quinone oxidoreductase subunit NuoN [Burkholderiaceae bacterium]
MSKFNLSAVLPEAVLLAAACLILVADLFVSERRRNLSYSMTLTALAAVALCCWNLLDGQVVQYAFGGMFVTDPMAQVLKLFACLATALGLVYAQNYARTRAMWHGELFSLALFTLLGVMVMISANNLLVIYLGLELQSLALYALVALQRDQPRAGEAAMKYFVLGALASGFLLYGMSMLYGATGSLDINEIAHRIAASQVANRPALVLATVFLVAGIGFKLGAAPFHMWVPDVYHGAPTPVTLLIASAPKIAAFAVAFRLLVEGLAPVSSDWHLMLLLLAMTSLAVGNLTAVAQSNLKRMLGYSTVGQMGFMLLAMQSGVAGGTTASAASAYSAAMFYMVTYALATLAAFGTMLLLSRQGFEAEEISDLAGLFRRQPWYAFVMAVAMFSLAGVPPTAGFYAKLVVLQALLADNSSLPVVWIAVIAVLFSLVGAYYYIRVVKVMYFDAPVDDHAFEAAPDMKIALTANGLAVLVLGVLPQYLLGLCASAMVRTLGG